MSDKNNKNNKNNKNTKNTKQHQEQHHHHQHHHQQKDNKDNGKEATTKLLMELQVLERQQSTTINTTAKGEGHPGMPQRVLQRPLLLRALGSS